MYVLASSELARCQRVSRGTMAERWAHEQAHSVNFGICSILTHHPCCPPCLRSPGCSTRLVWRNRAPEGVLLGDDGGGDGVHDGAASGAHGLRERRAAGGQHVLQEAQALAVHLEEPMLGQLHQ